MESGLSDFEKLNLIANVFQILDLTLNLSQTTNDEIMQELLNQNRKYLEKIINNQEKIIKMLENKNIDMEK